MLTTFKYKISGSLEEYISVATTRLETMLVNVAIAVNPKDERFKDLHSKIIDRPFHKEFKLKIITDESDDIEFGTGAFKITTAHDPKDFAIRVKNNLDSINIFTDDEFINENGYKFKRLHKIMVKKKVEERLKQLNLFVEKKDNPMSVPICSRSGDIIEPLLKPQCWVNLKGQAVQAMEEVQKGNMNINPSSHVAVWNKWLSNLRDWYVSRQL